MCIRDSGSAAGSTTVYQGAEGVPAVNEAGDNFGGALAWGDVDGNGVSDLIVGSPTEDLGTIRDTGAITVLYGAATGSVDSSVVLHQDSRGVAGINEAGDGWGTSLASGDLNGDGYDDVLVGAPFEDVGSDVNAGAVTVLFGGPRGLSGAGSELIHQDSPGVPGVGEAGDGFGMSVAVAGARSGTSTYVAIGSPWEDIENKTDAGAVTLLGTDSTGISNASMLLYPGLERSGSRPAMPEFSRTDDRFGYRLAGVRTGDLVIGTPYGKVSGKLNACLLYTSPSPRDATLSRMPSSA